MYSNKTLGVKDISCSKKRTIPKFANAQKQRTRINVGYKPVNVKNNYRINLAEQGDFETLKHSSGRKAYVEKARELGVYDEITEFLSELREENIYLSQQNIRDALVGAFPEVFEGCSKYGQNLFKAVMSDENWGNALMLNKKFLKEVILGNTVQRALKGIREEVDKDGKFYEIGMKDSDTIKLIQVLDNLEQADKKTEIDKLQVEYMKNKNRLLEAQIKQIEQDKTEDSYIDGFLKDLDQLDNV
jgi:hypothetical protein